MPVGFPIFGGTHDRARQARRRLCRRAALRGGRFEHQKRQLCARLVGFDRERVRLEVVPAGRSHPGCGWWELPGHASVTETVDPSDCGWEPVL
jgi:hypothetical protein